MKHDVLAREWFYDLLTRPNIRISQLGGFAPNIIYDTLPYLEYRIKGKKKRVKKYFLSKQYKIQPITFQRLST